MKSLIGKFIKLGGDCLNIESSVIHGCIFDKIGGDKHEKII